MAASGGRRPGGSPDPKGGWRRKFGGGGFLSGDQKTGRERGARSRLPQRARLEEAPGTEKFGEGEGRAKSSRRYPRVLEPPQSGQGGTWRALEPGRPAPRCSSLGTWFADSRDPRPFWGPRVACGRRRRGVTAGGGRGAERGGPKRATGRAQGWTCQGGGLCAALLRAPGPTSLGRGPGAGCS